MKFGYRVMSFLAEGNRPIRILVFGGIFLGWLIMTVLARLLGVDTGLDDDIGLGGVLLIIFSLLAGFGISVSVFVRLEAFSGEDEADGDQ